MSVMGWTPARTTDGSALSPGTFPTAKGEKRKGSLCVSCDGDSLDGAVRELKTQRPNFIPKSAHVIHHVEMTGYELQYRTSHPNGEMPDRVQVANDYRIFFTHSGGFTAC
jgi:hypothetical protein